MLEGADGCGKSTQTQRLVEWLRARGSDVVHVRDPGSTALSEAVRRIVLDPASGKLSAPAEMFLYMAARAQLVAEVVAPALADGHVVVCERWTLSTEVYQGIASGVHPRDVRRIGTVASGGTDPGLTLVLDVPIGGGLARLTREHDRMERKGDQFHARVVRGYRRLARGRRRCVLVAAGSPDEVEVRIRMEVEPFVA